jgi:hypothetical protein
VIGKVAFVGLMIVATEQGWVLLPPLLLLHSAGAFRVTLDSVTGSTVVLIVSRLFAGAGSSVLDVICTVLVIAGGTLAFVTVPVNTIDCALLSPASDAAVQVSTFDAPGPARVNPPACELTPPNVTPAGSWLVSVTFCAADGPLFVKVSVYWITPPAVIDAGAEIVTARSADVTVTLEVALT